MRRDHSISFVLPLYNEETNIENAVKSIKSIAEELSGDYEIILVDDASTDRGGEIIDGLAEKDRAIKAFHMPVNSKFGGAFAEGFRQASKEIIMYMDSDMPVSREDLRKSFPLIEEADIVNGYSRVKKGETLKRKMISAVYNFIIQGLFKLDVKDINSGYKIVRREMVKDLDFISRSPFVDVELFLHAKRKNAKVSQFPLVFQARAGGRSHIARLPVIWATFVDIIKVKILSGRKTKK